MAFGPGDEEPEDALRTAVGLQAASAAAAAAIGASRQHQIPHIRRRIVDTDRDVVRQFQPEFP